MEAYRLHHDKDGEPFFGAPLTDKKMIRADKDNTAIYTHGEKWNQVDHIFIRAEQRKKKTIAVLGAFVWRQMIEDFDEFTAVLTDEDFNHFHTAVPAIADVEAWVAYNTKDLEGFDGSFTGE